jgi:hypothetical protein
VNFSHFLGNRKSQDEFNYSFSTSVKEINVFLGTIHLTIPLSCLKVEMRKAGRITFSEIAK